MIDRVIPVGNVVAVDVCGLMVRSVLWRGTRPALCLFLIIWEIIGWLACLYHIVQWKILIHKRVDE